MKKYLVDYRTWGKAGDRINEKQAHEHFQDPIKVPISIGYRILDGSWREQRIDYAWTSADKPGATFIPAINTIQ